MPWWNLFAGQSDQQRLLEAAQRRMEKMKRRVFTKHELEVEAERTISLQVFDDLVHNGFLRMSETDGCYELTAKGEREERYRPVKT